jgi:hypothetical protein
MDLSSVAGGDRLFSDLIATKAFQRLKSVRFLGGIDYVLVRSPNGFRRNTRYTRFQHSLGVARLALLYCNAKALPYVDRRLVYTAALLHDIGHAPLSHSLEPVFKEVFGLAHHQATEDIVTGRSPLGAEVYNTLRGNKVDIERVTAIIAGEDAGYDGFFAGPINFDTIEGILRARAYTQPIPCVLSPEAVTEAAIWRSGDGDRLAVDEFWSYKDQVYRHVINSPTGVLADFACQAFMRRHLNALSLDDYFVTEKEIFHKLPGLLKLLTSRKFGREIMRQMDKPIRYTARHFFIDPSADFFANDDKDRYRQSKEDQTLLPDRGHAEEPVGLIRDLFDDHSD